MLVLVNELVCVSQVEDVCVSPLPYPVPRYQSCYCFCCCFCCFRLAVGFNTQPMMMGTDAVIGIPGRGVNQYNLGKGTASLDSQQDVLVHSSSVAH